MEVRISENFKRKTTKAILSIILFLIVYVVLTLLAIALTVACVIAGFSIIVAKPTFVTLILGVGLAGLGFFILAFLFKFIFKKNKMNRSHLTEITRDQEPHLFHFIDEIVKEVQTDFPKKIYLSSEVNASVFYDSSFWSLFFPVKKNLLIGMGLINTVTEQEFKAILAHEFGHFSQKSMKVGSYVYYVNQVIYNLLYDNESFEKMILKWGNMNNYFRVIVNISIKIILGIQWLLKKIYDIVNINYLALSREMEFHADEVAANVAGIMPIQNSLLRLDLASQSYNEVLNFYEGKVYDKLKSENIFEDQSIAFHFFAKKANYSFENGLPLVTLTDNNKYNKSKLVIGKQWETHPSTEDRIAYLSERFDVVPIKEEQKSAKTLFVDIEKTQKTLTNKLFSVLEESESFSVFTSFETEFVEIFQTNSFPTIYNGYYDQKNPLHFDLDKVILTDVKNSVDELFTKQKIDLLQDLFALENNHNTLIDIDNKVLPIKDFEYDGIRYDVNHAKTLLLEIEKEISSLKEEIEQNDLIIYSTFFCYAKEKGKKEELRAKYLHFFAIDSEFEKRYNLYLEMLKNTEFTRQSLPFDQIKANFNHLKDFETTLKVEIKKLLESKYCEPELISAIRENLEMYLKENWVYFDKDKYIDEELDILFKAISNYSYLISREYFWIKKDLLQFQADLLSE